ncbi:aminotransferase class III-fold pyridoxal phosphate-dependent enzyme [Variovorax sp. LjRoot175]|uniref:aspartate aminotransferase family protein n=1 Tax=Variovorax sp. LjRoot175 TaxID=3342276 RepID=UPI003ECCA2DC
MAKDAHMLNSFDSSALSSLSQDEVALIRKREEVLGPAYRLFYEEPLHIVRGEGVFLYDREGRAYLDAYNNVASVGHCRPEVVEAIYRQATVLNTHTRYLHESVLQFADELLGTFPDEIGHAMFTCTGSEANDLALRVASKFTGGTGVIVTKLAYHGVTASIAEISPSLGQNVPLGHHVRAIDPPDTYLYAGQDIGLRFADGVRAAIADLRRYGIKPSALIVDSIFTSDGVFTHPPGFLQEAAKAIREAGGIYIADEVQSGFARTGSNLWGFQRHGVVPDIVTMGKPMGNGHPVAGLVARPEVLKPFGNDGRYFNTFGGNPVSIAAAAATLAVIKRDGLQANSHSVGKMIRSGFEKLALKHGHIGDVRGDGLFIGVELVTDRNAKTPARELTHRVVNGMRRRGVLISSTGTRGNVLKIRPLLPFKEEHANQLLHVADQALADL